MISRCWISRSSSIVRKRENDITTSSQTEPSSHQHRTKKIILNKWHHHHSEDSPAAPARLHPKALRAAPTKPSPARRTALWSFPFPSSRYVVVVARAPHQELALGAGAIAQEAHLT
jgi:hypothetical protein